MTQNEASKGKVSYQERVHNMATDYDNWKLAHDPALDVKDDDAPVEDCLHCKHCHMERGYYPGIHNYTCDMRDEDGTGCSNTDLHDVCGDFERIDKEVRDASK